MTDGLVVNSPAWTFRKISDVTTKVGSGSTPRGGESVYKNSGVALIRSMNVYPSGFRSDGLAFIDQAEAKKLDHVIVQPDDVLLNITGASIGRVTTAPTSMAGARVNQHVCIIRPTKELVSSFLAYYLASPEQQTRVMNVQVGATRQALTKAMILNWDVPVPAIDEQQRIVAQIEKQFSRLDEAVASLKRTKANLKRYKASVLKAAVEGCLVPTEAELSRKARRSYETAAQLLKSNYQVSTPKSEKKRAGRLWGAGHVPQLTLEELSKLPEGWAWAQVRQLGFDPEDAVQVGPMSMRSRDFREAGVPVLNVGCVQWGRFDATKLNYLPEKIAENFSRYRIQTGDVLFTRSGTVGRCAVAKAHQRNWLMTFHLLRARPNPNCCLPEYLRAVFEGAVHIRRQTKEASIGTTRAGFNTNLLADLDIPLPPIAEQQRIVTEVERRLSVIEELEATVEANLTRADRLRQSVLGQAFSGELFGQPSKKEADDIATHLAAAERQAKYGPEQEF